MKTYSDYKRLLLQKDYEQEMKGILGIMKRNKQVYGNMNTRQEFMDYNLEKRKLWEESSDSEEVY